ncbi:MAG TPA: DinB family protein [Herpetosiphonaceae bacterium]|nr:DinB family protein [Herpetosiphonaceae bacterium]
MNMTDVKTLFDYNYWATTRVLRAAEHIRQDQFVAPLSGQTASLRDVLVHIMSAERLWRVPGRQAARLMHCGQRISRSWQPYGKRQHPFYGGRPLNKLPIFFEYTQFIACASRRLL